MSRAPKPGPLCVVSIRYEHYLLPQAQALKLVEIMAGAVNVQESYEGPRMKYTATGSPDVSLSLVKPEQIVMPDGEIKPAPVPRDSRRRITDAAARKQLGA